VSRYSEFDGYCLFGFLVHQPTLTIDLLVAPSIEVNCARGAAAQRATTAFADQVGKAGLTMDRIERASVSICTGDGVRRVMVGTLVCDGYEVVVEARARIAGREYRRARTVFVAPHDPTVELCNRLVGTMH
jgi:nitrate reductase beta subunit